MASELSVANAIFSFASICMSALVGYLSARRISDRTALIHACAEFRAAFVPVCLAIRRSNGKPCPVLDGILADTSGGISAACELFLPFVGHSQRAAFERARRDYEDAAELGSGFMYKEDEIAEVKRCVEKLLEHADHSK